MKKKFLSLLVILTISSSLFSQIKVLDELGNDISGQTFVLSTDVDNPNRFQIQNNGSSAIYVVMDILELVLPPELDPLLVGIDGGIPVCWFDCKQITRTGVFATVPDPSVPSKYKIPANSISPSPGDTYAFSPTPLSSQALIKIKFYELTNPDNYAIVTYDTQYTSINNTTSNFNTIFAYPNPAMESVNFKYNLKSTTDSYVLIYNILGKEIKRLKLNKQDSEVNYDLSGLESGVYFYSLIVENQTITTKKLVVK